MVTFFWEIIRNKKIDGLFNVQGNSILKTPTSSTYDTTFGCEFLLRTLIGWIVSSAKKSLSRFGDLVPLFSKKFNSVWINGSWSAEFFIGRLTMMDAIELCNLVPKSIFSGDVELDSLVVFPTVAVTDTVSVDWVDVLDRAKSDEKFLCKIFLAVLMIAVFDEWLISSFFSARGSVGFCRYLIKDTKSLLRISTNLFLRTAIRC
jgi:hypothetical protein